MVIVLLECYNQILHGIERAMYGTGHIYISQVWYEIDSYHWKFGWSQKPVESFAIF